MVAAGSVRPEPPRRRPHSTWHAIGGGAGGDAHLAAVPPCICFWHCKIAETAAAATQRTGKDYIHTQEREGQAERGSLITMPTNVPAGGGSRQQLYGAAARGQL